MIIIRIMGGLGNQMFQYALFKDLLRFGKDVKLDLSWYSKKREHNNYELKKIFNVDEIIASQAETDTLGEIHYDILNRIFRKIIGHKKTYYYQDINSAIVFDKTIYERDNIYLAGYWQSEKYFSRIEDFIKATYIFPEITDRLNLEYREKILNSNAISIHVRRGDYLKSPYLKGICNENYYKRAIDYIKEYTKNPTFFVFSDDIEWCKKNIKLDSVFYIEHNKQANSYIDMQLMSLCTHNIIANSSFSWWGAWLNNNKNKTVIAPIKWFNKKDIAKEDIIPEKWIRL